MAFHNNPRIINIGMELCLDANATSSYPGTGSTWYDLSKSPENGTLYNTTFNSDGYFDFGGTAHVANWSNFDYDDSGGEFTVCAWLNPDTFVSPGGNSYMGILNRTDNSTHIFSVFINTTSSSNTSGDMASWIFDTGGTIRQHHANGNCILNLNEWNFCVWRWQDTFGYTYDLFNSEGQVTRNASSAYSIRKDSTSQYTIGRWRNSAYYYDGQMGCINFYGTKLTDGEIKQNFNAQKSRFGL